MENTAYLQDTYAESHIEEKGPVVQTQVPKPQYPMIERVYFSAPYTVLSYPEVYREAIIKALHFLLGKYDTIQLIGTGTSGAMMMILFQHYAMNSGFFKSVKIKPVLIRKPGENTHRSRFNEYPEKLPTMFIDDHISSGNTINEVSETIKEIDIDRGDGIAYKLDLNYNVEIVMAHDSHSHGFIRRIFPNLKYILT